MLTHDLLAKETTILTRVVLFAVCFFAAIFAGGITTTVDHLDSRLLSPLYIPLLLAFLVAVRRRGVK